MIRLLLLSFLLGATFTTVAQLFDQKLRLNQYPECYDENVTEVRVRSRHASVVRFNPTHTHNRNFIVLDSITSLAIGTKSVYSRSNFDTTGRIISIVRTSNSASRFDSVSFLYQNDFPHNLPSQIDLFYRHGLSSPQTTIKFQNSEDQLFYTEENFEGKKTKTTLKIDSLGRVTSKNRTDVFAINYDYIDTGIYLYRKTSFSKLQPNQPAVYALEEPTEGGLKGTVCLTPSFTSDTLLQTITNYEFNESGKLIASEFNQLTQDGNKSVIETKFIYNDRVYLIREINIDWKAKYASIVDRELLYN